jgi:flagella basal body P-ring formation protein FlgA
MKHESSVQTMSAIAIVCACIVSDACFSKAPADEIRIQMKEAAAVHGSQVLVGSIATVSCSDPIQRGAVENAEIKLLDLTLPSEMISRRSLTTRLVLAGFPMDDLKISGAEHTIVAFEPKQQLSDTQVEEQALAVLAEFMNVTPEDLHVSLQSGFVQSLPQNLREMNDVSLNVMPPARRSLGQVTLSVQLRKNDEVCSTRSAVFDVRRRHRVAVAQISLSREVPLDESSVQFENRFMSTEVDELKPEHVLGRSVRGTVVAGSVIQMRDLQIATRSNAESLIRKGSSVQVVAVARRLRTSIRNVEALEDGRLGERIRMKNRDSGKEIVGEVLGPGQAIVRIK